MLRLIAAFAAAFSIAGPAMAAEPFPTRPVTLIVGAAPGGTLDALARLIAGSLSAALRQPVVVENTAGAGGLIGMQRLMKADPNGYTLLFANMGMTVVPLLHPKASIDVVRDVAPVSTVATVPMVLSVSNKSGIQDLPSLLAKMRSGGPKINLGSGGPGTTAHLAEGMFLHVSRTQGELVQYRGSGPALTDLMAGVIDGVLDQTVTIMPLHQDKRIKAIAVSAPARLPQMPDVPTFAEGGLPEFDLAIWNGVVAPAGTSRDVIDTLAKALSFVIDSPEFKGRVEQLAARAPAPAERGPAPFAALIRQDTKRVTELAERIGLIPAR